MEIRIKTILIKYWPRLCKKKIKKYILIKTEKKRLSSTIEREILMALKSETNEKKMKIIKSRKALSLYKKDT